jgi:drug/metabolite transporter (DMT)-like permease
MSKRTLALLAALGATTIYGINHTLAKGVMPTYVQPFGFILIRVLGASLLFWLISFRGPNERIEKSDWPRLILCSLLGMVINMLAFFKGLQLSTPINSAVLVTISPIIVVVLSAFLLKERITISKSGGIALGFVGALVLVLFGAETRQDAPNIPLGNLLFILNATYHPFTLMKWLFTIAIVINFPITIGEFSAIEWATMPLWAYGVIAFVVVCTTFMTYLFNVFAMTQLKASTVGAFIYLQPVIGILFALFTGKDELNPVKVGAAVLVLVGVYLASRPARNNA